MNYFDLETLSGTKFLKLVGIVLFALIIAAVVLAGLNTVRNLGSNSFGFDVPTGAPYATKENAASYGPTLSVRNAAITQERDGYTAGDDSEDYEVKEYNARIETRNRERDCGTVRGLNSRADVIFERASEYERGCTFSFKVKKESVEYVLEFLKDLNPRELNETSYTIKREVSDYTSEIAILENKLASYDTTLTSALASYENITGLATRTGNADALAKVIESKVGIIERLTALRISTIAELDRMNRAKAEALDRLEYTYFSVSVYENTFIDPVTIKDSWKRAVQTFVNETNRLLQDLSIGVVSFLLTLIKFALYFVIIVVAARYGWGFAKRVWEVPGKNGSS